MLRHISRPSPALVVALSALFVALSGSAVAAGIVPLAKHARTADSATVADNARHLGGKTAAQLAATMRGPQGAAGAQGPAGAVGPAGPAGPAGAAGPNGDTGAAGAAGAQGPRGEKGEKGDVGTGLNIVGTVAAATDLPATGTIGDGYLIGDDLYVWTGSEWTNTGPVRGPAGPAGAVGPAGPAGPAGPTGPEGSAAVSIHTQAFSLAAQDDQTFTVACGSGQKAVSGGFDSNGDVFNFDTKPTPDDSGWEIILANGANSGTAQGTVYAVCLG
jgi:hypothetical protein